ncbi:MAG: tetratricopeptide repeat protein [Bacteroidota bacterium]
MKYILASFLCLILSAGFAQNKLVTDSLMRVLKNEKRDTSVINIYNQLAWEYRNSNINLTDSFATLAIAMGEREKFHKGTGQAYINKGFVYRNMGEHDKAIRSYRWALVQFLKCNQRSGYASAYNNIASIHKIKGSHGVALFYYFQSLKISEQLNDDKGIARTLNNIGVVLMEQKQFAKALIYYNKCYNILERLGDENGMADCLNNIGSIYEIRDNKELAIANYQKCADINERLGDKKDVSSALHNIGLVYFEQRLFKEALRYYHQSLLIDESLGDIAAIIITYENIADCYIELKMYHAALKYANNALSMALAFNLRTDIMNAYDLLHRIEEQNQNYKEALDYHELYKQYSDSIYNAEVNNKLGLLEEQYLKERSEKQDIIQNKEGEINLIKAQEKEHAVTQYIFIIGLVLIIFVSLIYIVFFLMRKTKYS